MAITGKRMRLGEILIKAGVLTEEQLQLGLARQQQTREPIGQILVSLNMVTDEQIKHALEVQYGVKPFDLKSQIPSEVVRLVPESMMRQYKILPVAINQLTVAMVDPGNILALDDLRLRFKGVAIQPVVVTDAEFEQVLRSMPRDVLPEPSAEGSRPEPPLEEGSVDRMVQGLLANALKKRATEVVIEPREREAIVRFRVDGELISEPAVPARLASALMARLRVLADLSPTVSHLPQAGVLELVHESRTIQVQLRSLPTRHGPRASLYLQDPRPLKTLDLASAQLHPKTEAPLRALLRRSAGLVLLTGPQHSGKRALLEVCLKEATATGRAAIALDLPHADEIPGVTLVSSSDESPEAKRAALEAVLQQSTDILATDHVDDPEVARRLVRGTLAGRLTLMGLTSTQPLLDGLIDLGELPPRTVAQAVAGIVTLRRVKRLCPACRVPAPPDEAAVRALRLQGDLRQVHRAGACPECRGTGYQGQIRLVEAIPFDARLRALVADGAPRVEIEELARLQGYFPLRDAAAWAVAQGLTSIDALQDGDF